MITLCATITIKPGTQSGTTLTLAGQGMPRSEGKTGGFGASINLSAIAAGTGGFVINGQSVYDRSGRSVASAGDVNGDGIDEVVLIETGTTGASFCFGTVGQQATILVSDSKGGWKTALSVPAAASLASVAPGLLMSTPPKAIEAFAPGAM